QVHCNEDERQRRRYRLSVCSYQSHFQFPSITMIFQFIYRLCPFIFICYQDYDRAYDDRRWCVTKLERVHPTVWQGKTERDKAVITQDWHNGDNAIRTRIAKWDNNDSGGVVSNPCSLLQDYDGRMR